MAPRDARCLKAKERKPVDDCATYLINHCGMINILFAGY